MVTGDKSVSSMMNESTLKSINTETGKFNWIEYTVLSILLGFSILIGLYYGCIKKNQNTEYEYMWGGKSMKVFPIGLSLIIRYYNFHFLYFISLFFFFFQINVTEIVAIFQV